MVKRPVHDVPSAILEIREIGKELSVVDVKTGNEYPVKVDLRFMKSGQIKQRKAMAERGDLLKYNVLGSYERSVIRNLMAELQGRRCVHCGNKLHESPPDRIQDAVIDAAQFPIKSLIYPVHLHHCHATGALVGAVHARCNADLFLNFGE